jgi:hypothetical protein
VDTRRREKNRGGLCLKGSNVAGLAGSATERELQKNKISDAVELGASQTTKGAGQNKTHGEQL